MPALDKVWPERDKARSRLSETEGLSLGVGQSLCWGDVTRPGTSIKPKPEGLKMGLEREAEGKIGGGGETPRGGGGDDGRDQVELKQKCQ